MNILVTGGAGYIGSHTVIELLASGHQVVVVDNLSNSSQESLKRIEKITEQSVPFYEVDVCDQSALDKVFQANKFDAVIHFAGLKAVGESVQKSLIYYRNNIDSTLGLLEAMQSHSVKSLVFSSSATVYGLAPIPYQESMQTGIGITNPYGQTKAMIEQIMRDHATAHPEMKFMALRYFNPIGAHPSGLIGEDPTGTPNNLMPFITQVASGKREVLSIFGDNYDTVDGTCVRDYIHVVDLAKGHVAAVEQLTPGFEAINLGSGKGISVKELVDIFERTTNQTVPVMLADRRAGDLPEFFADAGKAADRLGWHTELSIADACADSWRWQSQNPNGFTSSPWAVSNLRLDPGLAS